LVFLSQFFCNSRVKYVSGHRLHPSKDTCDEVQLLRYSIHNGVESVQTSYTQWCGARGWWSDGWVSIDFFLLLPFFSLFSLPNYKGALSLKFDIQFGPSSFDFHLFCLFFFFYLLLIDFIFNFILVIWLNLIFISNLIIILLIFFKTF